MTERTRRDFLADVGRGMLVAGVGYGAARDLGLSSAWAADDVPDSLTFGDREPLVRLLQDTAADKLLPMLVEKWKSGTSLRDLVAAAALANARTFGGEDYIGFHTMMALAPAFQMSRELPSEHSPLPVLKVLYRNSQRIQEHGGHKSEILHPVALTEATAKSNTVDDLHQAVLGKDRDLAEQHFARIAQRSADEAFNDVLEVVQDNTEVHRVVMPYRAWDLLDIVGREHAHTMLRQSVRYCVKAECGNHNDYARGGSRLLPKLFDQFKLVGQPLGTKVAEDGWVEHLSKTLFAATPDQAAEAVAAALAEGFAPDSVGEAITLAANQLLLRDMGRPESQTSAGKPVGSVHGDSIGVHACDSANAWRNMARVSNARNTAACLILGAWQMAHDRGSRGGDFLNWQPWPLVEHTEGLLAKSAEQTPAALLGILDAAIKANDQALASAAVAAYSKLDQSPRAVFDVLLKYSISEDGALHAEKFYRTVSQEFATTRPGFRWRHVIALSRVAASECGRTAAGYEEAKRLLQT